MGKLEMNKKIKENALFQTAYELFTTKGLVKTTISDIVDRAGVAKGTFYLYFKDKYDLVSRLVKYKTEELFLSAYTAMCETGLTEFEEQFTYIIDFILDVFEEDPSLLNFISKNLAWGIFHGASGEEASQPGTAFYQHYIQLLENSSCSYIDPDYMLFSMIELVGATCYNCSKFNQPSSLTECRPYLHMALRGIMRSFALEEPQPFEENVGLA